MGYCGRLGDKIKAQELRRRGLSYGEILQQISVSKDTISRWCREIVLSETQKNRLLVAADNKRNARLLRTQNIFKEAKTEIGNLSKRDRFIAGIMLYAGEGEKTDGKGGFANSDPKMISFMMNWFKEFCNLPIAKFRGALWLHENRDEKKAKEFWSKLTGIPTNQFHKTYIAENKTNSKKIRKKIHEYGVFAIKFTSADKQRKIIGWISALLGDKIQK